MGHSDIGVVTAALPDSYAIYHVPRLSGTGGGIALIHSLAISDIRQIPSSLAFSSFEYLEVCFLRQGRSFRLLIVYRPGHPGTDGDFMVDFGSLLERLLAQTEELLILGDFNYWIDDPSLKPYSLEFVELLELNNMINHVLSSTHIHGHTLDLVLTPGDTECVQSVEVMPIDHHVSDHALIICSLAVPKPLSYSKSIVFRSYRDINFEEIGCEIQHGLGADGVSPVSGDVLVSDFNSFFGALQDRFCPLITKTIQVREDSPWYTRAVSELRRQRRRAERRWRRLRTDDSRLEYIHAKRAVGTQIFQCKVEYFQHHLELCNGNQQKMYRLLNTLLGRHSVPNLPKAVSEARLANNFSEFFASKISRIRSEIEVAPVARVFSVDFLAPLPVELSLSQFEPVSEDMVHRYIQNSNKTYCSLDPINVMKLGSSFGKAAPYIRTIINAFFREGSFVTSEKRALIRPYLKKADLNNEELSNYRPVSNLSFLSKIIEHAILDQLMPFLEQSDAISKYQSAYRKFHSAETALLRIHSDLVENVCMGKTSILVFLDLSAAFDTVDHQILLSDLASYRIEGKALQLLESYLSDRTQCVAVGESVSEPRPLLYGVPQGSVLGPILFLVYTSSLVLLLEAHGVGYHFYADDTQLYIKIDNVQELKEKITLLLGDIRKWMYERKLKLNDSKTEIMIVRGNLRNIPFGDFGVLNLGNVELAPVQSAKNLGVFFDSALSFRMQVNSVVKQCSFHIRNLYMIRKFLNKESILILVHSLILSKVDYCNSLLLGLPSCTLKKLQSVLNRAARLIFQLPPRVPTTSYMIELHWLPVRARVEFKICLITFKALKFQYPQYIVDLLTPVTVGIVMLRSADDPFRLLEPRAVGERAFADRSFSYAAPRLYNRLPVSLKQVNSVESFKKHLKAFLFARAYDQSNFTVTGEYKT